MTAQHNAVGGYAFGDSAPAARRLGMLADLFEPASRPFLARFAGRRPPGRRRCSPRTSPSGAPQAVTDGVAGEREVRQLVEDLEVAATGGRPASITWELRQVAWEA